MKPTRFVPVVLLAICCAAAAVAWGAGPETQPAKATSQPHPGDPAVQELIWRRHGISDPALRQLVRSLMTTRYPERLSSAQDIETAPADAKQIDIRDLPLRDYPLLRKFSHVREINLDSRKPIATDRHLEALASLGLDEVACITAQNCSAITDQGISSISKIRSVRDLGLEGTSITDKACDIMARSIHVTDVNVANCTKISFAGLKALAASDTLGGVSFSVDGLTEEQVFELLNSFKNVKRCELVDLNGKFDPERLVAHGERRKVEVIVRRTGALQETWQAAD